MSTDTLLFIGAVFLIFVSGCLFVYGFTNKKTHKLTVMLRNERNSVSESDSDLPAFDTRNSIPEKKVLNCTYESIQKRIDSDPASKLSVISDELGLPIACLSKKCEELATVSVLFLDCESRLKNSIAFDELMKVVFVDRNGQYLTISPVVVDNHPVYISVISTSSRDYESLFDYHSQRVC